MTFFKFLLSKAARDEAVKAMEIVAKQEARAKYLRELPHLSSTRVSDRTVKYRMVFLDEDYSPEEFQRAYDELAVFYEFVHKTREGLEEAITTTVMDGELVLRFKDRSGGVVSSGNGWHPGIFPNIINVEDVLEGRVDLKGNLL